MTETHNYFTKAVTTFMINREFSWSRGYGYDFWVEEPNFGYFRITVRQSKQLKSSLFEPLAKVENANA